MRPWLLHDPAARGIVVGAALLFLAAEALATVAGRARDRGRAGGSAVRQDRGTRWILEIVARVGIGGALAIAAFVPALRAGADTWWTLALGIAVVAAGVALRSWAIVTLGRYFRRWVTIEAGQQLVRRGPYQLLRHPSYAGIFLIAGGFGLAFGSWVSAAVALGSVVLGTLPRIRVEERALAQAFGAEYADYAGTTARVLPHVW